MLSPLPPLRCFFAPLLYAAILLTYVAACYYYTPPLSVYAMPLRHCSFFRFATLIFRRRSAMLSYAQLYYFQLCRFRLRYPRTYRRLRHHVITLPSYHLHAMVATMVIHHIDMRLAMKMMRYDDKIYGDDASERRDVTRADDIATYYALRAVSVEPHYYADIAATLLMSSLTIFRCRYC